MGRSTVENFKRRFGDPPRIIVEMVPFDSLGPAEARYRRERVFEAYKNVLGAVLNREPTEDEIFGRISLEEAVKK